MCNFRLNSVEVDRNESGEDDEDGGVVSKVVVVEGFVVDFFCKEVIFNNDFR